MLFKFPSSSLFAMSRSADKRNLFHSIQMPAPSLIQIIAESDMTCNFKVKERNHHTNMITLKESSFPLRLCITSLISTYGKRKKNPAPLKLSIMRNLNQQNWF